MISDNLHTINLPDEAGEALGHMITPFGLIAATINGIWLRANGEWRQIQVEFLDEEDLRAQIEDRIPMPCRKPWLTETERGP